MFDHCQNFMNTVIFLTLRKNLFLIEIFTNSIYLSKLNPEEEYFEISYLGICTSIEKK